MSIKDFEEIEAMKVGYLKHCFESAQEDLDNNRAMDGNDFFKLFVILLSKTCTTNHIN